MSLTVFGFIWFLILSFTFMGKGIDSKISVLFFSMVLQCNNVLIIGERGIGPQVITSMCFVLWYIFLSNKSTTNYDSKSKPFLILLSIFCFYILANSIICNVLNKNYSDIILLYVYLSASICLFKVRNKISNNQLWNIMMRLYVFLLIMGVLQLLATIHIIPKWLLSGLFFNDTSELVYFNTPELYARITSTFMEPSYYSGLLCGFIGLTIYNKGRLKNARLIIICGLLELILTFSSTGYLTFIGTLFLLILLDRGNHNFTKYFPILLIILVFIYVSWDTLMNDIIVNKLDTSSGLARQSWNLKALEDFYSHPEFGSGYMNVRASSLFLSILANLGIVGLVLYLSAVLVSVYPFFINKRKRSSLSLSVRLMMFSVVISQVIACPDISLCTFWLCVYMISITNNREEKTLCLLGKTKN